MSFISSLFCRSYSNCIGHSHMNCELLMSCKGIFLCQDTTYYTILIQVYNKKL